jgi:3-oxoacyl-[acyl-carrier protein] reductase
MDLQLNGKTCLVTGASKGIGYGAAKILAAEGARVAILARREHLLHELADEIAATGVERPVVIASDVTAADAPNRILEMAYNAMNSVDILVNSAGGSRSIWWNSPEERWDEGMTVNFTALRRLTTALVSKMIDNRYGRILNITGSSEPGGVNVASAAKAAVHAWSKGLSRELGRYGITVNSLLPGRIHSEQIDERLHPDPEEQKRFADANIPAGYFGDPRGYGLLNRVPRLAAGALYYGRSHLCRRWYASVCVLNAETNW